MTDRFERQSELVPRDKMPEMATVIGCGAIGRQVATMLAAIGTPKIQLIDHDVVEDQNRTTQAWNLRDIGLTKVDALEYTIHQQVGQESRAITSNCKWTPSMDTGEVVFMCVDSIAVRSAIYKRYKFRKDLIVDGRMMGETLRVLAMSKPEDYTYYESTLFEPEEAVPGRCTMRSTVYCAKIAAGFMLTQFTKWLRGYDVDRDTLVNLLSMEMSDNAEYPPERDDDSECD